MAILGRIKSALDDAIETVTNNFKVQKSTPVKTTTYSQPSTKKSSFVSSAGDFASRFAQGYQNYQQQKIANERARQQQAVSFTKNILGKVGQVASGAQKANKLVKNYYNPTSDLLPGGKVQNFWTSPVAKAVEKPLTNLQTAVQTGNLIPRIQVKNPVLGFMANAPGTVVNAVYGKGITAPVSDMTQMVKNTINKQDIPKYSELNSPVVRLGYQQAAANNPQRGKELGVNSSWQEGLGNMGGALEPIINAWTGGKGVDLAKSAILSGKPLLRTLIETGLSAIKPTVLSTAAYSLNEGRAEKSLQDQLLKTGINSIIAVPIGFGAGATLGLVGIGLNKLGQEFVNKFGRDAQNLLVNKDVLYRVSTNQATQEELAFVKTLNGDARAAAARNPEGVTYTQFDYKKGPVWDAMRKMFPSFFDGNGMPTAKWSDPRSNPIPDEANKYLTTPAQELKIPDINAPETSLATVTGKELGNAVAPQNEAVSAIEQAMQKEIASLNQNVTPVTDLPVENMNLISKMEAAVQPLVERYGLSPYKPEDYANFNVGLSSDGTVGYAVKPDGDLISVFNTGGKGKGAYAVVDGIENGATKLDCYDGALVKYYSRFGFEPYKKEANWTPGEPDVVYMKLNPEKYEQFKQSNPELYTGETKPVFERSVRINGTGNLEPTTGEGAGSGLGTASPISPTPTVGFENPDIPEQFRTAPETIETPVKTDEELAMEALNASRGFGAITPEVQTTQEVRPVAQKFVTQLNQMKTDIEGQLGKIKETIKNYQIYKGQQALGNEPQPVELTPENQAQVESLTANKKDIDSQISQAQNFITNYDLVKQMMPDLMSKEELQQILKALMAQSNDLTAQINDIISSSVAPQSPSAPLMNKTELRELAKSLNADLVTINKLLKSDAANETRDVTKTIQPETPLTDEELAMQALNASRGYSEDIVPESTTPTETQVESVTPPAVGQVSTPTETPAQTAAEIQNIQESLSTQPVAPPRTAPGEKTRKLYTTVQENATIPQSVKEAVADVGNANYTPQSRAETMDKANQAIFDLDAQAQDMLTGKTAVDPMKLEDYIGQAIALSQKATAIGNTDLASKLYAHSIEVATSMGRSVDLFKVLKTSSPDGMIAYAQKLVDQANERVSGITHALDRKILELTGKPTTFALTDDTKSFIQQKTIQMQQFPDGPEKWEVFNEILRRVSDDIPLTLSEAYTAYRYNNMLSNPLSHLRNVYGNFLQVSGVKPITDINATMIEAMISGKDGVRELPLSQVKTFYNAIAKAFPDAKVAAGKTWKSRGKISTQPDMREVRTEKMPKALTISGRALESMDMLFTTLVREGIYAQEMARPGADPKKALLYADKQADYFLFRNRPDSKNQTGQGNLLAGLDKLSEWINMGRKLPLVNHFVPFMNVAMNIAKMNIEYSPLQGANLLTGGIHGGGLVSDKRAKVQAAAKMTAGIEAMTIGTLMALAGLTSWTAPSDAKQKAAWYDSGRKPSSMKVQTPFGAVWAPFTYAGPFALALAIPAAIAYYQKESPTALSDDQLAKAGKTIGGLLKWYATSTPLSGLGTFLNVAEGNIDYNFGNSMAFIAGQNIPANGLLNFVTKIVDPIYRKASGFKEGLMRQLPVLSTYLEPHTKMTGAPSTRNASDYVLPYGVGIAKDSFENYLNSRTKELQGNAVVNSMTKEIQKQSNTALGKMLGKTPVGVQTPSTGLATSSLDKTQLAGVKKQVDGLMELYFQTNDEKARQEIANTITTLGVPFNNAMESYLTKDLDLENTKGLSEKTTSTIKRSNEYAYMRELRNKYQDLGVGDEFLSAEYQRLGIDEEELNYDDKTKLADDVQLEQIQSEIGGLEQEEMLTALVAMRRVSEGSRKALLTDTLISDLVDAGAISEGTGDYLKTIGWDAGKGTFKKLAGKAKKPKTFDVSIPKPAAVKYSKPSEIGSFSGLGKSLIPVKSAGITLPESLKVSQAPTLKKISNIKTRIPVMRNKLNQLGY